MSKAVKEFSTLDIETMNVNNEQQPVMVSFTHSNPSKNGYFLISKDIINNPPLYVKLLWDSVFNHIILSCTNKVNIIFVHNLGGFDGYFIFKYLANTYPNNVNALVDMDNRFITITLILNEVTYILKIHIGFSLLHYRS